MTKENLGIIAGSGKLPSQLASIYSQSGGKCFVASLDSETHFQLIDQYMSSNFQIGQVGGILKFFKENKVTKIIIIGGIQRPDLKSIKVDLQGSMLLAKIMKQKILGDDNVLKCVSAFLEDQGFEVISPMDILKIAGYDNGKAAVNCPNAKDETDIEIGQLVLNAMGALDIGQSVIVFNSYVLGVEAAEGTDNLIRRCEILRRSKKGGVLVKMSKPTQDMRLDTPTIGPDTIFYLAKHGYNGVAVERNGVIIIDPEETRKIALDSGIFITLI